MLLPLLVGCAAPNSCAEYVAAAFACTEDPAYDEASICGEWSADAEDVFGEMYRCRAEAWRAADCTSGEGIAAAEREDDACFPL